VLVIFKRPTSGMIKRYNQ